MVYKATRELAEIKKRCCDGIPELEEHHFEVLAGLELKKTAAMRTNRTWYYVEEIYRYNKEIKVLRTAHMGETRGGKSEGATMSALIHQYFYNQLFEKGHFDNVDVGIEKKPIDFTVDNIHRNDIAYLDCIRDKFKEGNLVYGEIHQIDEREMSGGGLGTMTGQTEIRNYNNIIAKYNVGEHWIYPKAFIDLNTSYGIHWFIKDVKERVNWGLLYKIGSSSAGLSTETFIGWICFPLHSNDELRNSYEKKKNDWIERVISGGGDARAELRKEAADLVSRNPMFAKMKSSSRFMLTNDQQLDIIDTLVASGKLTMFNSEERKRIMSRAQLLVKMKNYPEEFVKE